MTEPEGREFQRKILFSFSMLLLVGGVLLYWYWGIKFDTLNPFTRDNIGIYAIYSPMIAFGIIGMLLFKKKRLAA